jgi:hypothetical protein
MTIGGVPPNGHKPCFFAKSGVDKKPDFLGILIYFPKIAENFVQPFFSNKTFATSTSVSNFAIRTSLVNQPS